MGLCEFQVTLAYKGSSKSARTTQRNWIELETGILSEVIQTLSGVIQTQSEVIQTLSGVTRH